MSIVIKGGVVLGVAVGLLTMIVGFTGLYRNPAVGDIVFPICAIAIELGVLIWALRQTASIKRYWGQVGTGTLIAVVGGVIIIASSLIFTAMFPDYKDIALAAQADGMRDRGMTEEQIEQSMPFIEAMTSPIAQALVGFVMTILFGFVLSLIVAAFARKKGDG